MGQSLTVLRTVQPWSTTSHTWDTSHYHTPSSSSSSSSHSVLALPWEEKSPSKLRTYRQQSLQAGGPLSHPCGVWLGGRAMPWSRWWTEREASRRVWVATLHRL